MSFPGEISASATASFRALCWPKRGTPLPGRSRIRVLRENIWFADIGAIIAQESETISWLELTAREELILIRQEQAVGQEQDQMLRFLLRDGIFFERLKRTAYRLTRTSRSLRSEPQT